MRKTFLILTLFTLLLTACGGQTVQSATKPTAISTQSVATESVAPTADTGTSPTQPASPTQDSPSQAPASSGAVTYKIVPNESNLKFEVGETFINDNNRFNLAVGVTPQVSGEITIDMASPQNSQIGTITADVSQFKSDSSRRDSFIRQHFLESDKYPTVTFVPTQVEGLPQTYTEGQEIPLKISGNVTLHNVTKPVTFDASVKLSGNTLSGVATTSILMSDFGIGPISLMNMLKTEDQVKLTLTIVARP